MPARLAFPFVYEQLLAWTGANRDDIKRLELDAALGDVEARHELNEQDLSALVAAGGEVG